MSMRAFKTKFSAGLLSPLLDGRSDLPQYPEGCRILQNFLPRQYGGAFKRAGTEYIGRIKADAPSRLLPFNYSVDTTFVFELGAGSLRFWSNGLQVALSSFTVTAWSGVSSSYAPGDGVFDGLGLYACKITHTPSVGNEPPGTNWNLAGTPVWATGTAYTTGQIVLYKNTEALYLVKSGHTSSSTPDVDSTHYLSLVPSGWTNSTSYVIGNRVANQLPSGDVHNYRCKLNHTSSTSTQPGVGASWTTDWDLIDVSPTWATAKSYFVGDTVIQSGTQYICVTGHTSGTFATDLSAGKWVATGLTPWVVASTARSPGDIVMWGGNLLIAAKGTFTSVTAVDFTQWKAINIGANPPFPGGSTNWSASAAYSDGMLVYDGINAALYYALQTHTTLSTTEPGTPGGAPYWQPLANVFNWTTATSYAAGQYVVHQGLSYRVMTSHVSGTFFTDLANNLLEVKPYPLELAVPYTLNDLQAVNIVEINDEVFFLHPAYAPLLLKRFSDTLWGIGAIPWVMPPMRDQNTDNLFTLTPSGTTGAITLTASKPLFDPLMVGGYFAISQRRQVASTTLELNAVGTSTAIKVLGGYTIIVYGTAWVGNLVLEQSDDGVNNWLPLRNWVQSVANMRTINTTGTADKQVFLRFNLVTHTAGTTTDYATLEANDSLITGLVQITAVNSPESAAALVIKDLDTTAATTIWREGAYSDLRGYPSTGALHETRLTLAGVPAEPQHVRFSVTDDFFNFTDSNSAQDTGALDFQIASVESNAIQWVASYNGFLVVGTTGEEFTFDSGTGRSLTPTNPPQVKKQSSTGSMNLQPLVVGSSLIFFQNDTEHVEEFTFDFYSNKFVVVNLTLLAEQITVSGIKQTAAARQPEHVMYLVTNDGRLLSFTYEREQNVVGFAEFITDGFFESVAVVHGGALNADQVWVVVQRVKNTPGTPIAAESLGSYSPSETPPYFISIVKTAHGLTAGQSVFINTIDGFGNPGISGWFSVILYGNPNEFALDGAIHTLEVSATYSPAIVTTVRNMERLNQVTQKYRFNTDATLFCHLDSSVLRVAGTPQTVIGDLDYLEGNKVMVLADGKVQGPVFVYNGQIVLPVAASTVRIGLPFTAIVQGMKLEAQLQDGTSAGQRMKLNNAFARVYQSNGFEYTSDLDDTSIPVRSKNTGSLTDIAARIQNPTDILLATDSRMTRSINFAVRSSTPLPLNILGIVYNFDAGGD